MRLYKEFWKKSFDFEGFSDTSEYFVPWIFHISLLIIPFPVMFIMGSMDTYVLMIQAYFILALIPIFSSTLRRLNDNSVTRLNILWMFVPVLGQIFLIYKLTYGPHSSITARGVRRAKGSAKDKQRDSMVTRGGRKNEEDYYIEE